MEEGIPKPPPPPPPRSCTDEAWIKQVCRKVNSSRPVDHPGNPCTIFRVPGHIRRLDPEAYEPMVTCFGPFHYAYPYSSYVMQDHKWRCVGHLLSRHGGEELQNRLLGKCLSEMKKQDDKIRSCYSGELPPSLDAQNLASMMLLDGCFIIHLMLKMWQKGMEDETTEEDEGKKKGEWKIELGEDGTVLSMRKGDEQLEIPYEAGQSTFNIVVYDVLKLENQIPFFVIQLLFHHLKSPKDGEVNLVDLALHLFKDIHPQKSKSFQKGLPDDYHHLLHLFYSSRTPSIKERAKTPGWIRRAIECKGKLPKKGPKWKELEVALPSTPKWTPNAMELDRVGVKFKRNEWADSFLNIKFKQRGLRIAPLLCLLRLCLMFKSGWMEIPPLQIYGYTSHLLRNLMAFEQCYPKTEMYIMTYISFMDGIINQAEDVRLLRLEGILQHKLSNDKAAAELFNKLGSQIQFDWKSNYLEKEITEVIYRVDKFYEFKWHEWLAGLRRDYFGNPWTIISVLAATAILLLTVEQAIFSTMSYFRSS
ncbi:UPF0481 protein At3g47200-like [Elaeis guineensis]|uniref:UPF0481 protein At3g47200-like n=1 Tax=Elaeis guineensis var. tenera TaxID=51953 RepID=A0A6I9QLZ1_ELAGV|nr:UPF0481 protein At3g47200-like [Elaeis guineensis]